MSQLDTLNQELAKDFLKFLKDKHVSESDYVLSGVTENFEEYKYRVGYLRGLNDAKNEFCRLLETYFSIKTT